MLSSMFRKLIGKELPLVRTLSDLQDSRARRIVSENLMRISEIPKLYFELEETGGRIALDLSNLKGDRLPMQYKQLLAGAVINYEFTKRKGFEIFIDEELCGEMTRMMSIDTHASFADQYVIVANQIYDAFENAKR